MINYLKCKDVSRIASEAQDRKLGFREYLGMKIHLWICKPCVNYVDHLNFLQKAAEKADVPASDQAALSEEAKQRIKNRLNKS